MGWRREFKTFDAMTRFIAERPARTYHTIVRHDGWCTFGRDLPCICNPTYELEDLTVETFQAGENEQRQWLSRHKSN